MVVTQAVHIDDQLPLLVESFTTGSVARDGTAIDSREMRKSCGGTSGITIR